MSARSLHSWWRNLRGLRDPQGDLSMPRFGPFAIVVMLLGALAINSCSEVEPAGPADEQPVLPPLDPESIPAGFTLALDTVASGFQRPLFLTAPPNDAR